MNPLILKEKLKHKILFSQVDTIRSFACLVCSEKGQIVANPVNGQTFIFNSPCRRIGNELVPNFDDIQCIAGDKVVDTFVV